MLNKGWNSASKEIIINCLKYAGFSHQLGNADKVDSRLEVYIIGQRTSISLPLKKC